MAHSAWLDQNNVVVNVTVGVDENIIQTDLDGTQVGGSSEAWETFYSQATGYNIKRTSYNSNYRKNYAGIGMIYDATRDAFMVPKPFNSWVLDEDTCNWQPPTPMPVEEGKIFTWNEETLSWIETEAN